MQQPTSILARAKICRAYFGAAAHRRLSPNTPDDPRRQRAGAAGCSRPDAPTLASGPLTGCLGRPVLSTHIPISRAGFGATAHLMLRADTLGDPQRQHHTCHRYPRTRCGDAGFSATDLDATANVVLGYAKISRAYSSATNHRMFKAGTSDDPQRSNRELPAPRDHMHRWELQHHWPGYFVHVVLARAKLSLASFGAAAHLRPRTSTPDDPRLRRRACHRRSGPDAPTRLQHHRLGRRGQRRFGASYQPDNIYYQGDIYRRNPGQFSIR
ncbi:hypothetical protein JAB6_29320 [Janthinobacterium sp. HH104]|nr:hypothetical protein JAB6_29320 [Janthinobacterium sp. HH104]